MPIYQTPRDEIKFLLHDLLPARDVAALPGYAEATPEAMLDIIEAAGQLCEEVLFPINQSGDKEGCTFHNGHVKTPTGFKEAYDVFCQGGWTALACDPAYGGQGLPLLVNFVIDELVSSANLSFGIYPGLSHGAYNALHTHASDELKKIYLPHLVTGQWSGTMCLTEPHCGTDLGLIRTKAEPQHDGSYKISGTKIFISSGEHDLTENIIHLVLAKLPDAPTGTKGISLFVVPKFVPNTDGTLGEKNGVTCGSIEHKMGIKASATCVMNFDGAQGWLVGRPHGGMKAMFTMMNEARLAVALQGLGLAEVSYQNARAYARDRLQGRSLTGAKYPEKAADPLIVHPDVRKNLLTMKSMIEGARAMAYWIGMEQDISLKHADESRKKQAEDLVALMTPVLKSYLTDLGSEVSNIGMQIYGGHGYIHEWGMEQYVRDARICQIYEGANGIQALDLVGRKMAEDFGRLARQFFHPVSQYIIDNQHNKNVQEFLPALMSAFAKLQNAALW
ncbi:MAG: acyl-CoA dehydrogenase, partial [Alphaproteobacteria bacterium]|nr:acyl-CoA dehydrogenase [Alphaproteobacteria bacterium]